MREIEQDCGTPMGNMIADRLIQVDQAGSKLAQVQGIRREFKGSYTFEEVRNGKKELITMDDQYEKAVMGAIGGAYNELMAEGMQPLGFTNDSFYGEPLEGKPSEGVK